MHINKANNGKRCESWIFEIATEKYKKFAELRKAKDRMAEEIQCLKA